MKKIRGFFRALQNHIKRDKKAFATYIFLRTIVIFVLIRAVLRKDYESVFICGLSLLLLLLPAFIERSLKIDFPTVLEIVIMVFIFAAEIMGEISEYYVKFTHWDTLLHTTNGFLCAAIGFGLVDILNRAEHISLRLSPFYQALFAFCFSMTVGVLWEFFEFGCDYLLHTDMQKDTVINAIYSVTLNPTGANKPVGITNITDVVVNGTSLGLGGYLDIGLFDTMEDLFVNFIGAVIFCIIGYFYTKNKGHGNFAKSFIPIAVDGFEDEAEDPQPLKIGGKKTWSYTPKRKK
ncbi:MAG: hypothetical protein AB7D36_05180 [Oscillospiraceae bacterium]